MSVAKINKNMTIKVSKDTYDFLKLFSKKFNCSMASLCNHLILLQINDMDSKQALDSSYYSRLAFQIRNSYDLRRKF